MVVQCRELSMKTITLDSEAEVRTLRLQLREAQGELRYHQKHMLTEEAEGVECQREGCDHVRWKGDCVWTIDGRRMCSVRCRLLDEQDRLTEEDMPTERPTEFYSTQATQIERLFKRLK